MEPALVQAVWSSLAQTGHHLSNCMAPIHGLVTTRLSTVSHCAGTHCAEYPQGLQSCSSLTMPRHGDYYYCYQVERLEQEVGALVGSPAQNLNTGPRQPGLSHYTRSSQLPAHNQPGNALVSVSLRTEVGITMG